MNDSLNFLVSEAVECFDTDGKVHDENVIRLEKLLPLIVREFPINKDGFRISDETIEARTWSILEDIHNKPNPVDEFEERIPDIKRISLCLILSIRLK